jgi:hypothetical protein
MTRTFEINNRVWIYKILRPRLGTIMSYDKELNCYSLKTDHSDKIEYSHPMNLYLYPTDRNVLIEQIRDDIALMQDYIDALENREGESE